MGENYVCSGSLTLPHTGDSFGSTPGGRLGLAVLNTEVSHEERVNVLRRAGLHRAKRLLLSGAWAVLDRGVCVCVCAGAARAACLVCHFVGVSPLQQ